MRRVLIVDDELPIVSGLSLLFKRYFQGNYSVVGTAQTGREAIEKCVSLAPDIVLMDVQMPGITGLDAIREIAQTGTPRAFILVTAYERFDIAREALSMGVCDYLLKPVSKDRLEIALQAASAYLDRSQLFSERELEFRDRQQRLVPLLEKAFFSEIARDSRAEARVQDGARSELAKHMALYRESLPIAEETGIVGLASLSSATGSADSLYERLSSTLRYKTHALVGPLEDGRLCAIFVPTRAPRGAGADGAAARPELDALLEILRAGFAAELATGELKMSFGAPAALEELGRSWAGAARAFSESQLSEDVSAAVEPERSVQHQGARRREDTVLSLDAQLYDRIAEGQYALAAQALEKMLLPLDSSSKLPRDLLYRISAALSYAALKLAGGGVLSGEAYCEFMDFSEMKVLWDRGERGRFATEARRRFQALQRRAAEAGLHSPFVLKALQYIENHYQEPISLESAAEAIGISAGHLTRLMSDELKRGFAHTLIDFRVRRAKELLRQPALSIKEVSQRCGYPDANYFSRLFRRMTGWTPREYAARQPRGEDANAH